MHDRLKELRKSAHLSQKSLGNLIGISQQVVSRIERDSSTMTREHLELYADFFNVTTDYILGRSKAKRNLEEQRVLLDKVQFSTDFRYTKRRLSGNSMGFNGCYGSEDGKE